MSYKLYLLLVFFPFFAGAQSGQKLWYKDSADTWAKALPVGNGRLGAMVFGRVHSELIQLNEGTLWSGGPVPESINTESAGYLPALRKVLLDGEFEKGAGIARKMQGLYTESYMPLGDLFIDQYPGNEPAQSYYRELDLQKAMALTRYSIDGVTYSRQVFSSSPDQVIIIHMTASKPGKLNLKAGLRSQLHYTLQQAGNDDLVMKGKAPAHADPSYYRKNKVPILWEDSTGNHCSGMRFELILKAVPKGGRVKADTSGITINDADEVTIYISAATSFNGFDKCPDKDGRDEHKLARGYLEKALQLTYATLVKRHQQDFRQFYDRVKFELKDTSGSAAAALPSDERLKYYSAGGYDPGVETLYFNYGRYLLISCSRPGGMPANLQGIWNPILQAPWSSNYTININTQMNYWPAEVTNLSEMHQPLFDLIKGLSVTGSRTAKEFYGMDGWVANHNSDIWAASNPVGNKGDGDPKWANWPQGGNWLCRHLWEHYAFTKDRKFLKEVAYPLMKGAAKFCLDWLVKDDKGYWIMVPSTSPENVFRYGDGKVSTIGVATTMDMSIIWDLFSNLIDACDTLGIDQSFRDTLVARKEKLFPLQIGSKGNLQEWNKDYEDVEPHHRHVSHLFGLYPGHQIAPVMTPVFAEAARKTLELRGDEGTGWSKAWKINFWARLLDGNHAYLLIRQLLHFTDPGSSGTGGTYANFFDAHPPFQIDGNFGGTAGMAEMLLQSHLGEIHLLPSLPDAWKEGSVTGLKARGNFEVAIKWADNRLTGAVVSAISADGMCKLRTEVPVKIAGSGIRSTKDSFGYILYFKAKKGVKYSLQAL